MSISESLKSTLKMKPSDIVPITKEEADRLHLLGWSSGYGWDSEIEIDWYSMTSDYNSVVWVEEDYALYQTFCDDITKIRNDLASEMHKNSLIENSEKMYNALDNILTLLSAGNIDNVNEIRKSCNINQAWWEAYNALENIKDNTKK